MWRSLLLVKIHMDLEKYLKLKRSSVKFLHQELGFSLIVFETGYGDAALAWEKINSLSVKDYTNSFTSNFYYKSEEIAELISYAKVQKKLPLKIQGLDCQPQQDYLAQRMSAIIHPIDSNFAATVKLKLSNFNKLYSYEQDKDTIGFKIEQQEFLQFIEQLKIILLKNKSRLLALNTTEGELAALHKTIEIFSTTYSTMQFGDMMGWPATANLRDKSLFETLKWFKDNNPKQKIIIWAQNSYIENKTKPNYNVNWMGHYLKSTYGAKYYSFGAVVYSGKNLTYNGTVEFEHNSPDYLAYHLNKFKKEKFVMDLKDYKKDDFINQLLIGMENNGATASFVAKDRFDGLLFIKYSDIPTLLKNS